MGELAELIKSRDKLCSEIASANDNLIRYKSDLSELNTQLREYNEKYADISNNIAALKSSLDNIGKLRDNAESKIKDLDALISRGNLKKSKLDSEESNIESRITVLRESLCSPLKALSISDMMSVYVDYLITLDNKAEEGKVEKTKVIKKVNSGSNKSNFDWSGLRKRIKGFSIVLKTSLGAEINTRRTEYGVEVCAADFNQIKCMMKPCDWKDNVLGMHIGSKFVKYGFELENKDGVIGTEIRSFYSLGKIYINEYIKVKCLTSTMDIFDDFNKFDSKYAYFSRLVVFQHNADPLSSNVVATNVRSDADKNIEYVVGSPIPDSVRSSWHQFWQPLYTDGFYDLYINRAYDGWEGFKRTLFVINTELQDAFIDAGIVIKEDFLHE